MAIALYKARNAALEAKLAEANAVIRQLDPDGCAGYTEQMPEPCSPPIDSPTGPESLLQSARSPRAERGGWWGWGGDWLVVLVVVAVLVDFVLVFLILVVEVLQKVIHLSL